MALDYVIRYMGRRVHGVDAGDSIAGGSCDMEAGSIGSLTFELPPTHPMAVPGAFAVEDATREVTLSDGDTEIFRGWVKRTSLSSDLTLTVECESMLAYLKRTVVRPYSCRQATDLPDGTVILAQDPFEWMVAQHNLHAGESMQFQVGVNPHVGEVRASTDWKSTWDEMNDAFCTGLDRYLNARTGPGGERYLDLLDGGVGEGTQDIVLGDNVVDLEVAGESGEVATAIIALGTSEDSQAQAAGDRIERRTFGLREVADNEIPVDNSLILIDGDRAINQTLVDAYGIREEKRDYEASTASDLLRMVAADLNPSNVPEGGLVNSVTVQAIDLHQMNPSVQPISLLEWDRVFVRAYGLDDAYTGGRLIIDQWLPCSQLHIDLSDPSQSTYRFGDLPQTLTRQSALRMGMLRRGNGSLVRRTDATPWNNDRVWNRTNDVWDHADEVGEELRGELSDATERWSEHLDEQFDQATKDWYEHLEESVGEVAAQDAQGREELLKHLDEVEGKWSDDLGAIGSQLDGISGELGDLSSTMDTNHRTLLEGIRDVAQNAQRTFYGECRTSGSTRTVPSANLTRPGGETFSLEKGVVVDVWMQYAQNGSCTLNIASTGARSVMTNGFSAGMWQAGQVVRFIYDGTYWQACSTDIYGASITVGNPAQANFYTNGNEASLRIGSTAYWKGSMSGQTIGLTSQSHVDIGSSYIDLMNSAGRVRFQNVDGNPAISSSGGLFIRNESNSNGYVMLTGGGELYLAGYTVRLVGTNLYSDMDHVIARRSIVVNPNGHSYADVPASSTGVGDAQWYAWAASNGDIRVGNVAVTGASYNPNTGGITIHFAEAHTGQVRVNLVGIYCPFHFNDPGIEGPEIFDDGGSAENPHTEPETGEVA